MLPLIYPYELERIKLLVLKNLTFLSMFFAGATGSGRFSKMFFEIFLHYIVVRTALQAVFFVCESRSRAVDCSNMQCAVNCSNMQWAVNIL